MCALTETSSVTYAYPTNQFDGTISEAYLDKGIVSVPLIYDIKECWGLVLTSFLPLKPYKFNNYSGRMLIRLFESRLSESPLVC